MKRRNFLKLSAGLIGSSMLSGCAGFFASYRAELASTSPLDNSRFEEQIWLGKPFWANRLQDWRRIGNELQCTREGKSFEARTVSLLTRQLNNTLQSARLKATVRNLTPGKEGFCGFLLGIGKGELTPKAAALAQRAGGVNGGIIAAFDSSGKLSFRQFDDENKSLEFTTINRDLFSLNQYQDGSSITLDCQLDPTDANHFDIRLAAIDSATGQELGFGVLHNVAADKLHGGISLLSSSNPYKDGACWGFSNIETGGEKITENNRNSLGPVMGCMYTVNKHELRMTCQLMPVNLDITKQLRLEFKSENEQRWRAGASGVIEDGFVAKFSLNNWDYLSTYQYRIVDDAAPDTTLYSGLVAKDPQNSKEFKIALYSCIIPTSKSLDNTNYTRLIAKERDIGRYTKDNILFPHTELVENGAFHEPDMYVFCGDQYYETYPTRYGRDTKDAKLDTLYKWYLWYWAFAHSIKDKPTIILADDHDVLQGNLWGNSGENSDMLKEADGGFKWDKDLVRMIYRIQHGHNPEPYDATPIKYGIPVAYAAFEYGGISFAIVEDRKFKSPPDYKVDKLNTTGELLGERQEAFLKDWQTMHPGKPKICITASIWGSPQTDKNGHPLIDHDSNGYPADGRTRAVKLVSDANALVIAGDQHLGLLAYQGIDNYDDGSLFFAGPASAAFWQRWFEPAVQLPNQRNNDKNTGDFIDSFGNKMRVLAAANPKVSHQDFAEQNNSWGKFLADRMLKSEGYGIIKVNHQQQHYQLECWEWNTNPATGKQFAGWPYVKNFN
ncbi:alkaline phosphatase D family protein [Pseudoalteromonas sp. ZZD1]|uniref:alkaline phosphatase D family protein n=1 Tax=Pseudoalteromonas sp. ZZD1 TaxID=3139395 RepID=UPI003BACC4D7